MRFLLVLLFSVLTAVEAHAATRDCFDFAVVAHVTKETPTPFPEARPNEIIMSWPWKNELRVEQSLLGRDPGRRVAVFQVQHTSRRASYLRTPSLYLLKRRNDGNLWYVHGVGPLVQDRSGRFVLPVRAPLSDDELAETLAIPIDYKNRLRPIHYTPGEWDGRIDDDPPLDPAWAIKQGDLAVAKRGLFLSDLILTLRKHLCSAEPPSVSRPAASGR
jgi:hypothetical protein